MIIECCDDFYYMTKKQLISYLCKKGFHCLASSKLSKRHLIENAVDIFKKYGV